MNRHEPPSLEQRVVAVLDNPNASASKLSELVAETELAIAVADETVSSERAKAADIIATPDAGLAEQAISRAEAAKINRDRLNGVLPKLRERYTAALSTQHRDRWLTNYEKVKKQRDELLEEYKGIDQAYRSAKAERGKLIRRMQDCDLDAERVNAAACDLDIWDRQLEPLLEAPVPERRWGPPRVEGGLAVAMAQSMTPPPYNPARWSDPEQQAARRAEAEKQNREISEHYAGMTEEQEQRQNAEERERFAASRRAP